MGILLDTDVQGALVTRTYAEDGKLIQKREWDERPTLDANKAEYNNAPGKFDRKPKRMRRLASIDMGAYFEIVVNKMGIPPHRMFQLTPDEKKKRNSYLNSSEYRYLRTAPGKLAT